MSKSPIQKIVPHLWYTKEAEEAARFYATVFSESRVDRVTSLPADSPSGPAGTVDVVDTPGQDEGQACGRGDAETGKLDIAKLEAAFQGS